MNPFQNSFGGHIPQDVAGKQGENVIFIVYNLTDSPDTVDKVKDVCANFSAMIRSMRNRFPDMQFSCTMGFGADAWSLLMRRMDSAIWMVRRLSALWTVRRILLSMRIPIILR